VAPLRGQSYPRAEGLETLKDCKAAVDAAVAYLDTVESADLSVDPGDDVLLTPPGATMTASNFLLTMSYGHFFFHVTTAYDILRRQGVVIGRNDFMGAMPIKAMG
jgi:hypothetical protein